MDLSLGRHCKDNGNGTWELIYTGLNQPYAPLELYLMGLIPPSQVPPIHILANPDISNPKRVSAQSVRTITIENIINAEGGARDPDYTKSQKILRWRTSSRKIDRLMKRKLLISPR